MRIGIMGTGNVGGTLGTRWSARGHSVCFGVRDPEDAKVKALLAAGSNMRAGSVREAADYGDVVVLATPWEAVPDVLQNAGDLKGKVLVDATNPVGLGMEGLAKGLVVGHTTSAAEQVAHWVPGARVVKAFNTTGASNMANPAYESEKAVMFTCGDDADAKSIVSTLGEELGFEMVDAGPLAIARLLEPVAMLWIHLCVFEKMGPDFAFKLMKRSGSPTQ